MRLAMGTIASDTTNENRKGTPATGSAAIRLDTERLLYLSSRLVRPGPRRQQLQPLLEAQQAPQLVPQVRVARQVTRDGALDERSRQEVAIACARRQQRVAHVVAEIAAEPRAERDAEPHLAAALNRV